MTIENVLIVYAFILTLTTTVIASLIAAHIVIPIIKARFVKRFYCHIDGCSRSFYTLKGLFRHIVLKHDTTKGKDIYYV
jgi:multidrug efflux pump subunit AcrB